MKKIFISGPMSASNITDVLFNIHQGIKLGQQVLNLGFSPYIPHLDAFLQITSGDKTSVQTNYAYTMEWLKVSDCILVCPNYENSTGVKAELEMAKKLNIPVYYSIQELKDSEL